MLPKLSIAAKLYIIFSLLAVATVALAGIAVVNARHQAEMTERLTRHLFPAPRTSSA